MKAGSFVISRNTGARLPRIDRATLNDLEHRALMTLRDLPGDPPFARAVIVREWARSRERRFSTGDLMM